jgi:hypothetical protein
MSIDGPVRDCGEDNITGSKHLQCSRAFSLLLTARAGWFA